MALFNRPVSWDEELIRRYDLSGPRYTSYPTALQFREDFSGKELLSAIAASNSHWQPLSLYFHIPFCDTLCYYCACTKIVTHNRDRAHSYLDYLIEELSLHASLFNRSRPVKHLHWGGGTPTFFSDDDMSMLMAATRRHFHLLNDDSGEYAIEIHPGRISSDRLTLIRKLGFNRLSMGIQDFDPRVQKAVNRFNSVAQVTETVQAARAANFHSLSMDLIYGLPLQTTQSLSDTLRYVVELAPDRISLFNYAHMPHQFKSQRLINSKDLPTPAMKLALLQCAIECLQEAGYIYIGMDHFAKPSDNLVKAQKAGKLQRNFQGYSTHGDCDLLAFGLSAISTLGNTYVQNTKDLNSYQKILERGQLPFVRGLTLSPEDRLRRFVINQLICHFQLNFADVVRQFGVNPMVHFASELQQLTPMAEDGLLTLNSDGIQIENAGRLLVRRLCMVFDQYLQPTDEVIRYSKII